MIRGSIVAIVTPFKNGKVDEPQFKKLIEQQIKSGTHGIVPCGTTGETPTLTQKEHEFVIKLAIDTVKGRLPVIAGTGSNSTQEAIDLTKHAAQAGADAALVVSPYYNRPSQEGLYQHFKAVSQSVSIPIILYNIAGRTGVNIETPTVARLAQDCKNIIGVKEASGSLAQMQSVKEECPKDFLLFSGDDALTLPVLAIGGVGVISVAANIIPQDIVAMIDAFESKDLEKARRIHFKMLPLFKALFLETNPVPLKMAMEMLGMCSSEMRLPLVAMGKNNTAKLKIALKDYGLLKQ